jgi:hypothetical protein
MSAVRQTEVMISRGWQNVGCGILLVGVAACSSASNDSSVTNSGPLTTDPAFEDFEKAESVSSSSTVDSDHADSDPTVPATSGPFASVGGLDASLPDRDPDAIGVVGAGLGNSQSTGFLAQPSDSYYDGMALSRSDNEPLVIGADGDVLSVADLGNGDEIAVWVAGGCAESSPVQCDVVALHVLRPAP